jgi:hypothetical protein
VNPAIEWIEQAADSPYRLEIADEDHGRTYYRLPMFCIKEDSPDTSAAWHYNPNSRAQDYTVEYFENYTIPGR